MKKELANKLIAFQSAVEATKKEKINPFHKSKYADINAFLAVIKPVLSVSGLFLYQPIRTEGESIYLDTIITDGDDSISCTLPIMQTNKIQDLGAMITYTRRYAIQSLLALEADDDDGDGESVKNVKVTTPKSETITKKCEDCGKNFVTKIENAKNRHTCYQIKMNRPQNKPVNDPELISLLNGAPPQSLS